MKRLFWMILLIILIFTGCAKTSKEGAPSGEALKKQQLVVYTAYSEEVYKPLMEEFEERTGLWVEVHQGGTLTLLEKLKQEAECDVFLGGAVSLLEENSSLFSNVTAHSCTPVVLVYNPKLVKNSPPENWTDLMLPVWKGEIAFANPANSGSAYMTLVALSEILSVEKEILLEQLITTPAEYALEFSRDVVSEVANGNYYIGIALEETALRSVAKGYDISVVYPENEIVLTEGIAIAQESVHRENAELFVEFMQSEDVKRYLEEHLYRHIPKEEQEVVK